LAGAQGRQRWVLNGALTMLTFFAVLTPWTIRNYRALGVIVPIRDNIWLEFTPTTLATRPTTTPRRPPATTGPIRRQPGGVAEIPDHGRDSLSRAKARHVPRRSQESSHYGFLVVKTLRRIVYYWTGFWSFSAEELRDQPFTPENVFYVSTVTLFMLLGIRSLWRTNRTAVLPYLLLIGIFPITYYLTHPMMDYRQPLEPAVVVLGVAGALSLRAPRRVSQQRSPRSSPKPGKRAPWPRSGRRRYHQGRWLQS
jgi:hypothetical protein